MAECEMCGKTVGTRRYMVEGTVMNLGLECAKYGTPMDAPAPAGSQAAVQQGLERRAQRMTSKSVYEQESMMVVEDYGPRIHKAREAKGLSLEQLGNKVSARVPELKHIESGKLRPGDDLAKRLQKELGITLLEKVEGPPPAVSGAKKAGAGAGLTIGDLLKDAAAKGKKKA
ncbi:MAG: putative transcription factor [Thermoplasmata archaeon]|jgi:putative transcription factor|nr:putative transcription factor [Thermoplasmata archaeon]